MLKIKRLVACLLAFVMLGTTACGNGSEATQEAASVEEASASEEVVNEEPIEVRMIVHGEPSQRMQEFLDNEFRDAVLEAINVDPVIEFLPWSEYATGKNDMMFAAGEKFMTQTDVNYMYECISKGYLADLTTSMETYGQNILEYCGEESMVAWQADGVQYAIPFGNKPNAGEDYVFTVRQDLLESVGMTELTSFEDMEEFFSLVQEEIPGIVGYARGVNARVFFGGIETDMNMFAPYGWMVTDGNELDDPTMYNFYELDEFAQIAEITSRWVELGIIPSYTLSNGEQTYMEWNNANALFCTGASYRPFEYSNTVCQVDPDATFVNYYIGDQTETPLMSRGNFGTSWQVSAAVEGEELDAYIQLCDLLQSDIFWADMMLYGVEGLDYELNEDGTVEKLTDEAFFDTYIADNVNFKRYESSVTDEEIETFENWNEGSIPQKTIGFAFDVTPVSVEMAQISAVESEYLIPILNGLVDYDENIDEALERLDEAGIDVFIEEYERQFTEFLESK